MILPYFFLYGFTANSISCRNGVGKSETEITMEENSSIVKRVLLTILLQNLPKEKTKSLFVSGKQNRVNVWTNQ